MPLTPFTSEEAPHHDALLRAIDAGFQFLHLSEGEGQEIAAIYAERWCSYGVVESFTICGMNEASSARIRTEDYPDGDPLWQHTGSVEAVITELLALPPHGFPGAPTISRRRFSGLLLLPGTL
ncbi:hypothetical protein [Saccharopolyspora shandongensis]|uniref:hypothetical protein n=1 Tax=Saccharopolyspora shandongensis TaxID=418495 RepID=UPI0033C0EDFC